MRNIRTGKQNDHSCTSRNGHDPSVTFRQTVKTLAKVTQLQQSNRLCSHGCPSTSAVSKVPMILVPQFALHEQLVLRHQSSELNWHVAASSVRKKQIFTTYAFGCLNNIKLCLRVKYFCVRGKWYLTYNSLEICWYCIALYIVSKLFRQQYFEKKTKNTRLTASFPGQPG